MARVLEPWDRPYYDWRDPDMKVLGFGHDRVTKKSVVYEATAEERQQICQNSMAYAAFHPELSWRNDPSYFWRRKK